MRFHFPTLFPTLAPPLLALLSLGGCSKGGFDGPQVCLTTADTIAGTGVTQPSAIPKARWAELRHDASGTTIPINLEGSGGSYTGSGPVFDKCAPPGFYYVNRLAVTDVTGALVATAVRQSGSTYLISYGENGGSQQVAVSGPTSLTLAGPTGAAPTLTRLDAGAIVSAPQGGAFSLGIASAAAPDDCGIAEARFWLTLKATGAGQSADAVPGQIPAVQKGENGSPSLRVGPNVPAGEYVVEGLLTSKTGRTTRVVRQSNAATMYQFVSSSGSVTSTVPVVSVTVSADPMADRSGPVIASLDAQRSVVSRCDVMSFALRLSDTDRAITVPQEVVLKLRSPLGSEALTIKLKGTDAMTGSLVIPSDAPPGVWYAYPVSFSDDVGNLTTVSFSGGALSQAVVGAGSAVMATAASFTVQGPPMYDLSGITPVDLGGGVIPDMAKPFPTRLSNVSVVADPTPPVAGMSAPKVTAVWEQGSVLP